MRNQCDEMKFMPYFKFDITGLGLKWKQMKTAIMKWKKLPQSTWRLLSYLSKDLWGSLFVCLKGGILKSSSSFSSSFYCLLHFAHLFSWITTRHSYHTTLTLAQFFLIFAFFCILMALKRVVYAVLDTAGLTVDSGCLEYIWVLT